MAITTSTSVTSVVNAEFIARAALAAFVDAVFGPGGAGYRLLDVADLTGKGTKTASWPVEPTPPTAYVTAEGVDAGESQAITLTDTTATLTEKVAITTITDLAAKISLENEIERATRHLGYAHANKIDADVMALFNGLDTDCGSTGANATWTLLAGARQTLGAAKFRGPYWAVLHDYQWFDLATEGTPNIGDAMSGIATEVLVNYIVMRLADINLIISPNVPLANSNADRSGAVFSREPALGLCILDPGDFPYVAEERDESLRAQEITSVTRYAVVEKRGVSAVGFETGAS